MIGYFTPWPSKDRGRIATLGISYMSSITIEKPAIAEPELTRSKSRSIRFWILVLTAVFVPLGLIGVVIFFALTTNSPDSPVVASSLKEGGLSSAMVKKSSLSVLSKPSPMTAIASWSLVKKVVVAAVPLTHFECYFDRCSIHPIKVRSRSTCS